MWKAKRVTRDYFGLAASSGLQFWALRVEEKKNNVFKFLVKNLGEGEASKIGRRSKVGIITVSFFEAAPEEKNLRSRNFGETAKGDPINVKYDVKQ